MSKNISQGLSPDGARGRAVRHRRRRGSMAVLVVVALHGAVLWLLLASTVGPRAPWRPSRAADAVSPPDPVPMTWVTAVPSAVPPPAPRKASATPATSRASKSLIAPGRVPSATVSSAPAPATVPTDAAPTDAVSPGEPAVPAGAPLERTLRKEALRELSAGGRVWRDDPRLVAKPSASVESRLETGMAAAARGDCLRGEFKGSDMGLLSLPMLGLAAAQGRCGTP